MSLECDPAFYISRFQPRAGFIDEIALFLPVDEASCISLFIERCDARFDADEVSALKDSFPAIMALHEAHLQVVRGIDPATHISALNKAKTLSPRERDILLLLLDGRSTGEIAQRLTLTKGYIKNCRARMYRKLGVESERAMLSLFRPGFSVVDDPSTRVGAG